MQQYTAWNGFWIVVLQTQYLWHKQRLCKNACDAVSIVEEVYYVYYLLGIEHSSKGKHWRQAMFWSFLHGIWIAAAALNEK